MAAELMPFGHDVLGDIGPKPHLVAQDEEGRFDVVFAEKVEEFAGGRPHKWPFTRIPMDASGNTQPNTLSRAAQMPKMPAIFDGFWMHNDKDERINARHNKRSRSNLLFFDNSAAPFGTFSLPGVSEHAQGEVRWRF